EAFWLMEGYFVRTLGMHRVYNSAFMNMLKNEDNQKYRSVIKNTIEFNPEILKRYVNFMNNPDEKTAVEQFGKDDKYFGVCTMMVTMPGLPMFGHGQIEGFTEKYGMEYRRAYWDEQPDWNLIQRHEKEIFPLMKRRYLFADVQNFLLYDFFTPEGYVNENVFAYSNRYQNERALVVYNNKFEHARGWIKISAAYAEKIAAGEEPHLVQKSLAEGLQLTNQENYFCIFRDHISGLEYIRNNKQLWEQGLYVELGAFKYQVFLDFREVQDNEYHHYQQIHDYLDGSGVPSIDDILKEIFLRPIHQKFAALLNAGTIQGVQAKRVSPERPQIDEAFVIELTEKYRHLLAEVCNFVGCHGDEIKLATEFQQTLRAILQFDNLPTQLASARSRDVKAALRKLAQAPTDTSFKYAVLTGWAVVSKLGQMVTQADYEAQSRSWIDEWLLGKIIMSTMHDVGLVESECWQALALIKILTTHHNWFQLADKSEISDYAIFKKLLEDQDVQQFLQLNRYQDVLWFNKEMFELLTEWLYNISIIAAISQPGITRQELATQIIKRYRNWQRWLKAEAASEYQIDKLLEQLKD
ncbi:MAG: alpha-amylase, partial [candidate division KSB1 bacterium]|nr:alpha-amylase [candidate division KSB1 bacterium]